MKRLPIGLWSVAYLVLVLLCFYSFAVEGELTLGRQPWRNLKKTVVEMATPSFLNLWWGDPKLEYINEEGEVLRVEDERKTEAHFLWGLLRATWITIKIATLGSFLGSLMAFPLGIGTAKNVKAPRLIAYFCKGALDVSRSIHTLIFGLLFVGIFGLGPMAGILAIAAHSMGTFGKLYAEAIETLDTSSIEAVRATGATEMQTFFNAVWPAFLPQLVSTNLYLWEYNIRDSTILGLVGAGGLGLLVSEAMSLFQWSRLATILLAIILLVFCFDSISRKVRTSLL